MAKRHYDIYVPPKGTVGAPVLLIGEAPGGEEEIQKKPFVGIAGDKLHTVLERNGILESECYFMNLSNYRPHQNKFELLLGSEVLNEGFKAVTEYIRQYRPNLVVPLGRWPLKFICDYDSISAYRGSILSVRGQISQSHTIKAIPTYHPSAVARDAKLFPIFDGDFQRIGYDKGFKELRLPEYNFRINPQGIQLEEIVRQVEQSEYLAVDIETVKKSSHILCVGFAWSETDAVVIVPDTEEKKRAIDRLLSCPAKKIFQNGQFDYTQLVRLNGYAFHDPSSYLFAHDTLVAQHVMWPEMPASLAYLCSRHTRQPYYKSSGRKKIPGDTKSWSNRQNRDELYIYNATDCVVTYKVAIDQLTELPTNRHWQSSFAWDMDQLELACHVSDSGLLRDEERVKKIRVILLNRWAKKQIVLDQVCGKGEHVNVSSPKLKKYLYDKEYCGLPARRTRQGKITTNEDAVISLISVCKSKLNKVSREDAVLRWKYKLLSCKLILEIRGLRKLLSTYIDTIVSEDGRVRSLFTPAGPETNRWAARKYVDGSGYNMQTNPRNPIEYDEGEDQFTEITKIAIISLAKDVEKFKDVDFDDDEDDDEDD